MVHKIEQNRYECGRGIYRDGRGQTSERQIWELADNHQNTSDRCMTLSRMNLIKAIKKQKETALTLLPSPTRATPEKKIPWYLIHKHWCTEQKFYRKSVNQIKKSIKTRTLHDWIKFLSSRQDWLTLKKVSTLCNHRLMEINICLSPQWKKRQHSMWLNIYSWMKTLPRL